MLLDGVYSQVQSQKIKLAVLTAARESIINHIGPHGEDMDRQETETRKREKSPPERSLVFPWERASRVSAL